MHDIYPNHGAGDDRVRRRGAARARERADPTRRAATPSRPTTWAGRWTWSTARAFLSGAIYWTLREFEIYPGWTGGAGRRPPEFEPNTRHHKGVLTYEGQKKPSWFVLRDAFARTPLYASARRR